MTESTQYLELAKIEQLEAQLRREGYSVERPAGQSKNGFDLVARRGDTRIAFEVVAFSSLAKAIPTIRQHRRQAFQDGYNQFRLVIVNPPHETSVNIEGLDQLLTTHLRDDMPNELEALSSHTYVEAVTHVEFDAIEVGQTGIRVRGTAAVQVLLDSGGGERDGVDWEESFPISFDVVLTHDLRFQGEPQISVDTSAFYE